MTYIEMVPPEALPEERRVPDDDNIIQIHSIHPQTMRHHYDLYIELMRRAGPLTRIQREMIAVVVSSENKCHY